MPAAKLQTNFTLAARRAARPPGRQRRGTRTIRFTVLCALVLGGLVSASAASHAEVSDNPFANVDWNTVHYLHSMSHQHHGRTAANRLELYEMGFRHFAFSLYYPSHPTYPLPDNLAQYNDAIGAPNAEQHSASDTEYSMHFNTLGSFYSTGYGHHRQSNPLTFRDNPVDHAYTDLNLYDPDGETPGEGIYFLDINLNRQDGADETAIAKLTVEGGLEFNSRTFETVGTGEINARELPGDFSRRIYFKVVDQPVTLRLEYESEQIRVRYMDVRQGLYRPWRQAFAEALDGERTDEEDRPIQGLQYPDAGGITLNHPVEKSIDTYVEMLDFDERVLGIEVWNHRSGFGVENDSPHLRYYRHWDDILRTGRRCLAFFVKDHRWRGQGRNVLLVPNPAERTREQRERDALVAYRQGAFFGLLGAIAVDDDGNPMSPWDQSEFRFARIEVEENEGGDPVAVNVSVDGQDAELRPNVQIRFVTEEGIVKVADGNHSARYELPSGADGEIACRYVRIEAFAYPATHLQGEPLRAGMISEMDVFEISRLHDYRGDSHTNAFDEPGDERIPIVDMIFSQAIRF